jgi:hypothetical protein
MQLGSNSKSNWIIETLKYQFARELKLLKIRAMGCRLQIKNWRNRVICSQSYDMMIRTNVCNNNGGRL